MKNELLLIDGRRVVLKWFFKSSTEFWIQGVPGKMMLLTADRNQVLSEIKTIIQALKPLDQNDDQDKMSEFTIDLTPLREIIRAIQEMPEGRVSGPLALLELRLRYALEAYDARVEEWE